VRETQFSHLQHGYTVYMIGKESVGGAIAIQRNWGRVPDRWQVLFAVTDLDRTVAQTHGLGGSDDLPILDIPNVGRCASLLDDRQGLFIVMQPASASSQQAQ
jgi:predicted enzyme related to lactoylglutathione lyase